MLAISLGACGPSPLSGTPAITASPVALSTIAAPTPSDRTIPTGANRAWKVDVVNADRPLLVSITTDRAAWAWLVPANSRMVLLDEPMAPNEGRIELVGPADDCTLYDAADLPIVSLTILIVQTSSSRPDYEMDLRPGAPIVGPVNVGYFGGCSG